MGQYTYLYLGERCEIEAKNCLPISWLPLFAADNFSVVPSAIAGDTYLAYVLKTSAEEALHKAERAKARLLPFPHISRFLRPIEILITELQHRASADLVKLDATQLVQEDDVFAQRLQNGPRAFDEMLGAMTGDEGQDCSRLERFISTFKLSQIDSLRKMHSEDRMFLLFGTYWGDDESKYSSRFFDKSFWQPIQ